VPKNLEDEAKMVDKVDAKIQAMKEKNEVRIFEIESDNVSESFTVEEVDEDGNNDEVGTYFA
jgi:hypothetical protein